MHFLFSSDSSICLSMDNLARFFIRSAHVSASLSYPHAYPSDESAFLLVKFCLPVVVCDGVLLIGAPNGVSFELLSIPDMIPDVVVVVVACVVAFVTLLCCHMCCSW